MDTFTKLIEKGYRSSDAQKIIDVNERAWNDYVTTKAQPFWESLNDLGTGISFDRTLGSNVSLLATYVNNDVVHTCCSMLADAISSTPHCVYAPGKEKNGMATKRLSLKQKRNVLKRFPSRIIKSVDDVVEVESHPVMSLLNNDVEDLDHVDFIRLTALYLQIFGKAYWHLVRNNPGDETEIPSSIRVLKPHYVTPFRDLDGDVLSYFYTNVFGPGVNNTGIRYEKVTLEKADVIDFRWPAPSDPYAGGDSPLRAAFAKVAVSEKFNEWMNWLLNNRARVDGVLTTPDTMPEDERIRIEEKFNAKFKGEGNGGVLVSSVKFTPVSYAPQDLAALEINEELKKSLCNVLHLPYALVTNDSNYANMEASLELWARYGVLPPLSLIEKKINKYLMPLYGADGSSGGNTCFFAFDNPVPEDEQFELEEQKQADTLFVAAIQARAVTPNEIRARLGLDPIDGGDDLPEAPQPIMPAVADEGQAEDEPTEGNDEDDEGPVTDEADKALDPALFDRLLEINKAVRAGSMSRAIAINLAEAMGFPDARNLVDYPPHQHEAYQHEKATKPGKVDFNERIAAKLKALFRKQAEDVLAHLGDYTEKSLIEKATLPTSFTNLEDWDDDFAHEVKPLIELELKKSADGKAHALTRAGASPDAFSVLPAKVRELADKRAYAFAHSTNAATTKFLNVALSQLHDEIKEGLVEGDTIAALTDRVQKVFENATDSRAETIARSETSWAVHKGAIIAAKESGIVKAMKYLVSSDACPLCQDVADTEILLEDFDVESGDITEQGMLPLHPNCTCAFTEVLTTGEDE